MDWYLGCFKKYAVFSGRATRTEYWMFFLFDFIVMCLLMGVDATMGTLVPEVGLGLLSGIYSLIAILPRLAVAVRRLHDIGNSGWWLLIAFVPLIGSIVLLVKFCTASK